MRVAMLGLALCACSFSRSDSVVDAPGTTDAVVVVPDAGACVEASATCQADGVTLRSCAGPGATASDTTCAWGCVPKETHACGAVHPTGGGALDTDVAEDPRLDVDAVMAGTVDGDNGAISGLRGAGGGVVDGIGYELRTNSSGTFAIFRFKSLRVSGLTNLGGSVPIIFIANGPIVLDGVLDARGAPVCGARKGGPGGFQGGDKKQSAAGSGGGTGATANQQGGGGGGNGGTGGLGGNGGTGGVAFGDAVVSLLVGGGGG
ncbi:MAG: hypothetical protein KIT31_34440, partial [Deltaproteobacteria bacterium]|nr:hypothetical protein [Deltaproteobacteria bacterium]